MNNDNKEDIVDALLTARYYVGGGRGNSHIFVKTNADVNCDGRIDIIDVLLLAKRYVGAVSDFIC